MIAAHIGELSACIDQTVDLQSFGLHPADGALAVPAPPEGGGVVFVTYPFVLSAGDAPTAQ